MAPRNLIVAIVVAIAVWQLSQGLWIHAKAALGQHLLAAAWSDTQGNGQPTKPWPWADTWPIARLVFADHGVDLIVLSGAAGRNLAWGPAHLDGSALPGDTGNSVIAGHRDTHFTFLKELALGDKFLVETAFRTAAVYRVAGVRIADINSDKLRIDVNASAITLVTCYPFGAVTPGGPLRYVVTAERIGEMT